MILKKKWLNDEKIIIIGHQYGTFNVQTSGFSLSHSSLPSLELSLLNIIRFKRSCSCLFFAIFDNSLCFYSISNLSHPDISRKLISSLDSDRVLLESLAPNSTTESLLKADLSPISFHVSSAPDEMYSPLLNE